MLCEKPLGVDAAQAWTMRGAAVAAGVANAVGFNYRYVPAVALAKQVLDEERLGELRHYRALYLQDYQNTGDQKRSSGGAGAVLDYSHLVDMLRFLVGEPRTVAASTSSFLTDVDDAYVALFEFAQRARRGARGVARRDGLEGASPDRGSAAAARWWDMEDTNRLHVFLAADEEAGARRFRDVLVTQPDIRISASGGRRGVLGWEHWLRPPVARLSRKRCSRSEQSRPGRRSRTGIARPSCARRSTRPRGKEASRRRRDRSGDLRSRATTPKGRNEREQHAA